MPDELPAAQAKLIAALLDDRVPDGFDAKGVHATAAVLRKKRRKLAAREKTSRVGARAFFLRLIQRLKPALR